MIEFTLVGLPTFFVLISIFEISRGMWTYHTLASAVKEGTRFAIVHGEDCDPTPGLSNNCPSTVADVVKRISQMGTGLVPSELSVTLNYADAALGAPVVCSPISACFSNTTRWPVQPGSKRGMELIITGTYPFRSAITVLFPGPGGFTMFKPAIFPATSREMVQF